MTLFETNMLHPRKRINLSVREEEFLYLEGLAKVYGFKNVCDIVLAMTRLFMKLATEEDSGDPHRGDSSHVRGDGAV